MKHHSLGAGAEQSSTVWILFFHAKSFSTNPFFPPQREQAASAEKAKPGAPGRTQGWAGRGLSPPLRGTATVSAIVPLLVPHSVWILGSGWCPEQGRCRSGPAGPRFCWPGHRHHQEWALWGCHCLCRAVGEPSTAPCCSCRGFVRAEPLQRDLPVPGTLQPPCFMAQKSLDGSGWAAFG